MTASALLEQVRSFGVEVSADGDRVWLEPASRLSPEFIETLRARKAELLAALRAEQRHEDNRVGPWSPPGAITRCCSSCGGGLQPDDGDGSKCFTCTWSGMPARVQ